MLDVWRGALSPRTLLNLIDHLPRNSHYAEAMAQDEEVAEGLVDVPAGGPGSPPLTEFTPEVEAIVAVVDRLGDVVNTLIAANGGKPKPVRPWPRPVTALDRVRARKRAEAMDVLERKLFPDN